MMPGGGWYTRILAPYVAENGQYVAVVFAGEDTPIERLQTALAGWDERFPGQAEEWTGVPAADIDAICLTLIQISQLIVDIPEIMKLDINPLLANE